ncbi:hypothetical protein HQ489_02130 [Candidatus Woesearchaeota archaeon]|nr:hypothetical protein [Candidatus Woesearchaeota archaeon]
MAESQKEKIKNSLRLLENFKSNKITYRALGSILISALNKETHRKLGDIDIILEINDKEKAFSLLKKLGFKFNNRKAFGFSWTEATHPKYLQLEFLLIGDFTKEYFKCKFGKNVELRITSKYLKSTTYHLYKHNFQGIPLNSIYQGLKASDNKPNRMIDKKVFLKLLKDNVPDGLSVSQAFKIYIFGLKMPYAFPIFSYISDFIGRIRVLFGKKYYLWDK